MSLKLVKNILLGFTIILAMNGVSLSEMDLKIVLEQALVVPGPDVVAASLVLTFPPGNEGSPPHYHSGPVVGYVLEGSLLFQMADEPPRIISEGGSFYEKDRATHVWGANASDNTTCRVLATVFGRPNEPILTFVKDFPRDSRAEALAKAVAKVPKY